MTNTEVRPFRIETTTAELDDLMDRLARTRLPQPAPGDDWSYGTPNSYLRDAVERWRTGYDWAAQQERINAVPHFTTEIDGQLVHFVHVRSPHAGATPLLLAHTYPGSSVDYLDLIDLLTDPVAHGGRAEDAFDVVVPDAPGYGFSQPVTEAGWDTARIARAYAQLMRRLGYTRYGVHGSDHGAMVARELGLLNPEGFLGLHVLQLFSFPSGDPTEFERLEPQDHAGLEHMQWFQSVGGYNTMNASRPQTVAVGLSDSPVALLAYSELFNSFGNGTSLVPLDAILTEVTVNWFANAAAGMSRSYLENARADGEPRVNAAPTGVAVFADDFQTIRVFAERDNSAVVHWSRFERGGHFAALEVPDVLAGDIRAFFAGLC
ncbi:epoxide hydrolase [Pseudonocardia sp. KRD-184]|uniref:Epoxide hydrolase n=1 Tax=Pseudonocardia oceani TaxID=2792013 RepID=A0ABS6U473_9PSEU|nr:epoxide hydrolase [Pseudonocardia oceani]MBW0092320.1 epoxide hydrolase [Pseudonocardia oceani]MBW0097872.1 epoxide hydrolase [Pseudonocardia oceani]MBW0111780.1 epoxide hydrolase [Pseudonocardia oceani]MBW0124553.1 epoxide hydrolase [Pseudonocardia oceani]MBW0127023.1 epoxide hydrolase [Pseudonocardia oceani]